MATDHRGRDVHAGKRTVQESVNWQDSPNAVSTNVGTSRTSAQHHGNNLMVDTYPNHEESNWLVTTGPVGDAEFDGRLFGNSRFGGFKFDNGELGFEGRTRTPRRSMIAAESMSNRIKEGRNLRTGRPI